MAYYIHDGIVTVEADLWYINHILYSSISESRLNLIESTREVGHTANKNLGKNIASTVHKAMNNKKDKVKAYKTKTQKHIKRKTNNRDGKKLHNKI